MESSPGHGRRTADGAQPSKRASNNECVSLECDGSDWSDAVMVDFLLEDNAEMLADKEPHRLYAAMGKLTERQLEIVQLTSIRG